MRRVALAVLLAILTALVAVRLRTERPAVAAAAMTVHWDSGAYNVLELDMPEPAKTAGSSLTGELDGYYFSRTPTEKTAYTGLLAGRDLILLAAEKGVPEALSEAGTPALWRLRQTGACFENVYAPEWYQGADGRLFALLTGLIPTTVEQSTALAWVGSQGTYLPFSLGACLTAAGYSCRAYPAAPGREDGFRALGFSPEARDGGDGDALCRAAAPEGTRPCAVYFELTDADAERTAAALWESLERDGRLADTVICLWAEGTEPGRGSLFLWAEGLAGAASAAPCSDVDVTPTLLDLLGAAYDGRFLSGRDILADGAGTERPVSLSGSAYADWVTPAGRYDAAAAVFFPADGAPAGEKAQSRYVAQMRQRVYDQYTYARRALEINYFKTALCR